MSESDAEVDVVVIGAGPSGLALAAALASRGVRCRVVDRRAAPLAGARCPNLWQRSLYALEQVGIDARTLRAQSVSMRSKVFHVGADAVEVPLLAAPEDPRWPLPLLVRQDRLEALLADRAARLGAPVERGTEAAVVDQDAGSVVVETRSDGDVRRLRARWVVAADGEGGRTREALGTGWQVRRHEGIAWWQADVRFEGLGLPHDREDLYHAPERQVGLVPLADGRHRVFIAARADGPAAEPSAEDVRDAVREVVGDGARPAEVDRVWGRTPFQGMADAWVVGRVILLGDAARVFPMPVHGLNTGLQDAADLSWKLAAVVNGTAAPALLSTYEAERREVASVLAKRGEHVLWAGVSSDPAAALSPILRERRPRVRTEPAAVYESGPLTVQDPRSAPGHAGEWIAPGRVHTGTGATTVTELQAGGRWLVLSPGPLPPGVEHHPLAPRVVAHAELPTMKRPMVTVVRPDGYVGAEMSPRSPDEAGRDVLRYLDLAAAGGDGQAPGETPPVRTRSAGTAE